MSTRRADYSTDPGLECTAMTESFAQPVGEQFTYCLDTLAALIRRLAADKGLESAIKLSLLDRVIRRRLSSKESNWLLPTIKTALATRLEALIELEYGDLDPCLDRFTDGLRGLAAGEIPNSALQLQLLREQIKRTGEGQFSRWLLGSIDAALGKEVIFLWRPRRNEHQRHQAHQNYVPPPGVREK